MIAQRLRTAALLGLEGRVLASGGRGAFRPVRAPFGNPVSCTSVDRFISREHLLVDPVKRVGRFALKSRRFVSSPPSSCRGVL